MFVLSGLLEYGVGYFEASMTGRMTMGVIATSKNCWDDGLALFYCRLKPIMCLARFSVLLLAPGFSRWVEDPRDLVSAL